MKAILISIKHQYAAAIYAGTKVFELRKRTPKIPLGTLCIIYEPLPVGRVTGCFTYSGIHVFRVASITWSFLCQCQISYNALQNYYRGQEFGHAWSILNPRPFSPTYSLSTFGLTRPPQSYQFIDIPDNLLTDL